MDAAAAKPRILVADDDAVSLRFLAGALTELGCVVTAVGSGGTALRACAESSFDLLLLDRRMPDGGGAVLLPELRRRGVETTAIATSAELDAPMRAELRAAGYVEALTKPITLDRLARALALHLRDWKGLRMRIASVGAARSEITVAPSLLDDAAGLASVGGDAATLEALRQLLRAELEALTERIVAPHADGIVDRLHRLRASCRYCGAAALGAAAERLEAAVRTDAANASAEFTQFAEVLAHTLAAMSPQKS